MQYHLDWEMFQLLTHTIAKDVRVKKGSADMVRWRAYVDQECNAFKSHCRDATTSGCRGKLLLGARRAWPR
jgi:hypothetical protein